MMDSKSAGEIAYTFTNYLSDIIENDILEKLRYLEEPDRFYYTVLHKLRNILDAASFLITNLDGKPHYYDSVFLLLRTCLFDGISLYYVMDADNDNLLRNERINRIMLDHVKSIWTSAEDDKERQLVIEKFPDCFDEGKFKKEIVKVNIIMMYREIKIERIKNEVLDALRLYNIFSKVEHNGILSFNLLHAHYEATGADSAKYKVYFALKNIMGVTSLLVRHAWKISDEDTRFKEMIRMNNLLKLE